MGGKLREGEGMEGEAAIFLLYVYTSPGDHSGHKPQLRQHRLGSMKDM